MAKQTTKSRQSKIVKTNIDEFDVDGIEPEVEETEKPKKPSVTGIARTYKRNMSGKKKVFTDLFKLMVAKVIKYEGWDETNEYPETHPNKFSTWEHTHPFRTYDKNGNKVSYSTPIGGHFHVIEWEPSKNEDEPPTIISVSGPMVMKKKVVRGVPTQVPVPANDYDEHTHDIEYMRTSEIEFTSANVEASKVIAFEASKTAPIKGVQER